MNKWEDMFSIEELPFAEWALNGPIEPYRLICKSTGRVVGQYRDLGYAQKQAKRKFRKAVNRVEKLLLS